MANARKTVQTALLRVHKDEGYSNLVWNALLEEHPLNGQDVAFATSLFYGVLERTVTLDFVIAAYSKTPLKKIDLAVLEALRMGVYQLLYMDSVPDRAAINESVLLVKQSKFNRFGGFVNGILRSVQRNGNTLPDVDNLPLAKRLSVTHSVPLPLVEHYITHYGTELTQQLLPAFLGGRPLFVRVNCLKTTTDELIAWLGEEGITAIATDFPHTLQITTGGNPAHTKAFVDGLFHVQDPASGYACAALDAKERMRVLDVCAAPGGKSFTLSQMMNNKGEVFACDLYDHKIKLMAEGAKRLGLDIIHPQLRDATAEDDLGEFDRILCDLPCSGLGILGRKPEIRYKSLDDLTSLPALQYEMLKNHIHRIKPGGALVFSTCTLNPKENEDNVARLLSEFDCLEPYPILPHLPRAAGEAPHYINLFPHIHGTDGFFVAAVKRKAE